MTFYSIGKFVIASNKSAKYAGTYGNNQCTVVEFPKDATINVIMEGDEYTPDEE